MLREETIMAGKLTAPVEKIHGDPIMRFGDSLRRAAISLDPRTPEELATAARTAADPVQREQALYQLAARVGADVMPTMEALLLEETDPQVRINALWALQQFPSEAARTLGLELLRDKDARVRQWARVLNWEMGWTGEDFRTATEAQFHPGRTFDETIFLHIRCDLYIRHGEDNGAWGHMVLSPQMLARVYGQALACPITNTRERELVISKTLRGLHTDGTDHYEAFLFRGFTERVNRLSGNFYFESNTPRPFYLSGQADDISEGVIENVPVPFAREGQWFLNPNLRLKDNFAIEYVRGLFQGWAYVNLEKILAKGGDVLFPGNSVLSTLHHPVIGPRTNAFIVGSFKGKVVDWNEDGILDLNYLPSYATAAGEIDSNLDGAPDVPGLSVCPKPFQHR